MYTAFFGLGEKPFSITPDPRYLFLSERHAEALAHLLYGINEAGGFIQLTGEVGTGKTTIVRSLLGQIPKDAEVALILNPRVTPAEFMLTICEELCVSVPASERTSVKALSVAQELETELDEIYFSVPAERTPLDAATLGPRVDQLEQRVKEVVDVGTTRPRGAHGRCNRRGVQGCIHGVQALRGGGGRGRTAPGQSDSGTRWA